MSEATLVIEDLTPMFRQYFDLKDRYPGCLLLFRCGDFYEMYGDDAVRGAKAMEIAITSREVGKGNRLEMAGVPHHALDNYLKALIAKGIKVAVCEQLEDPRQAKGLVKRDVTRVITSGTILDPKMLAEDENNFLLSAATHGENTGLALADVSTGECRVTKIPSREILRIKDEIFRLRPSEVILDKNLGGIELVKGYLSELEIPWVINEKQLDDSISSDIIQEAISDSNATKDLQENPESEMALAQLLGYLNDTQKTSRHSLSKVEFYDIADYLVLDAITWRNLELTHTLMERQKKGSLLWVLDETKTGMGARTLRSWLEKPLIEKNKINARLDAVGELSGNYTMLSKLSENLNSIYDMERITSRVVYGSANARDLLALRNSLQRLPALKEVISSAATSLLLVLHDSIDALEDVYKLVNSSISEDPPISLKEGNLIKHEYSLELDEMRDVRNNAKQWIADLEGRERDRTGIRSLKVRFNNVFGYFIEVTRSNLHLVPEDYIRKQTIANGERFISPELKEYESKVLGVEEKIVELEFNLFTKIRDQVSNESPRIQRTSRALAALDALSSLAAVAVRNKYCRPEMLEENVISIKGGRHPVVEKALGSGFVPNDTGLDLGKNRFHVITGPNMSGKSTYLRQVGLISIMAQIGSFVPAEQAKLGLVDRVFTRVGASDDLHLGKSTFLVEMSETANIIKNASQRSLILLDEIGRGTSTYDGLSIAWAVSEYIHNQIGAKTLFATHFHQLTEMADRLEGVKNFRVDVKETNKEIIFLHRIVPGGTDKSYGIYVAKLAGLPNVILRRAGEILEELESSHGKPKAGSNGDNAAYQLTFFDLLQSPLVEEIKRIKPDELSPRDALDKIYQWKNRLD